LWVLPAKGVNDGICCSGNGANDGPGQEKEQYGQIGPFIAKASK